MRYSRYNAERVLFGMVNELKGQWGGELANVSAPTISVKKQIPGETVVVPTGMLSLLAPIVSEVPFHRVLLEKEVVKIEWKGELSPPGEGGTRAKVHTSDYSCYNGKDYSWYDYTTKLVCE